MASDNQCIEIYNPHIKYHKSNLILLMFILGGRPKSQVIGNWAPQFGLRLSQWNMFERRKNLTGLTVINTVLPWPPVTIIEEDAVGSISQSGKIKLTLDFPC